MAAWCAVEEGDRIAQLVLERIVTPEVQEVEARLVFISMFTHD